MNYLDFIVLVKAQKMSHSALAFWNPEFSAENLVLIGAEEKLQRWNEVPAEIWLFHL